MATEEEILLFHDQDYVRLVKRSSEKGVGLLDMGDTPAFKGCYEATASWSALHCKPATS